MIFSESFPSQQLYVIGISYRKTDAQTRGRFSVPSERLTQILSDSPLNFSSAYFLVSTCNRTELYTLASSLQQAKNMFAYATNCSDTELDDNIHFYEGKAAVNHLFAVTAGLDSQIPGDYEITGQIKQAVRLSKQHGKINYLLERLLNECFAAAKNVRTNTAYSSGCVSVSFAAIQLIKKFNFKHLAILMVGAGKISSNTLKNIRTYIPNARLSVVNRTFEKAELLAATCGGTAFCFDNLVQVALASNIVIVATEAQVEILHGDDFINKSCPALFIDLSVPQNIHRSIQNLPGTTLVNLDELSSMNDATLQNRKKEIPKVENILAHHKKYFFDWCASRQDASKLLRVKTHLQQLVPAEPVVTGVVEGKLIQKSINSMAQKLRADNKAGCYYLQALQEILPYTKN